MPSEVHRVRLPWLLRAQIAENVQRVPLSPEEIARAEMHAWNLVRERMGRGPVSRTAVDAGLIAEPEDESGDSSSGSVQSRGGVLAQIAPLYGDSEKTAQRRIAVVQAADEDPERYGRWLEQMNRSGKVNAAYKMLRRAQLAERIRHEPEPLPDGPFRVLVADPPWTYEKRKDDTSHRAALPYADMDIDEICELGAGRVAMDDAVLWLWTTNAHMREAFQVVDAWGFTQKTILTWVKDRMVTGDWLRGQTEHCLFCVRGKPTTEPPGDRTTVLYGPLRAHSRKPDEFYALVEALCPGAKLELFGREQRDGWTVWGAEKEFFDDAER